MYITDFYKLNGRDKQKVIDILEEAFEVEAYQDDEPIENMNRFVGIIDNEPVATYSVLFESKLIHSKTGGLVAHLEDLAVAKEHRGKGYAKEFMKFMLEYCKYKGCYKAIWSAPKELVDYYKTYLNGYEHEVSMRTDFK